MADPQDQKQVIDFRDLGSTGLKRFSGFVFEDFLQELIGWKGLAIYKEMMSNDPTIGACLFAIDKLTRQVSWSVKKASDQPFDIEAADFLESNMHDMSESWIDTISSINSFLGYGHSYHELVYKRRCGDSPDGSLRSKYCDGRIGWKKIPIRSQDTLYRWRFDDNGGIQGVEQLAPPYYMNTFIPIEKALLFRTTTEKNNPEGRSILRNAYRPWYLKKNIENIEGIGIERDLAGLPVALVPPEILSSSANTSQKAILAAVKEIVTNIRRDEQEGVVFPMAYDANGKLLYELKLLSTGGQRQFDTDKIVTRYDMRIAMSMLADFILLGQNNVGSFALASSKTNLFSTAIGSFLDIICEIFNRFAIPRLFKMNPDIMVSEYPRLEHGDIENVDLKELGDYIQKLAGAGAPIFPNLDLEKYLMEVANLPAPIDPIGDLGMTIEQPQPIIQPNLPPGAEIPNNPLKDNGQQDDISPVNPPPQNPANNEIGSTGLNDMDFIQAQSFAKKLAANGGVGV